jgi:hypothetical protein
MLSTFSPEALFWTAIDMMNLRELFRWYGELTGHYISVCAVRYRSRLGQGAPNTFHSLLRGMHPIRLPGHSRAFSDGAHGIKKEHRIVSEFIMFSHRHSSWNRSDCVMTESRGVSQTN